MMHNEIYRIIDANINRASEALRLLEDWSRFAKNSKEISKKLKETRHSINSSFLAYPNLIFSRESIHDVGRNIGNPSTKSSVRDILRSNCKRVEEALRVLSEYGQLLDIDVKKLEESRYEIYTLEKELIKNEKVIRLDNAHLYLVAGRAASSGHICDDNEFLSIIEKSIEGGVDIIQLREKKRSDNEILKLAREIKRIIAGTEVLFIINDRVDLALACDADGVHLGQDDLNVSSVRQITPEGFIIGLSTHSIEQGRRGLILGADYLGVGPVFSTPTKPDYKAVGLEYVRWASENIKNISWFAIGGIDETNAHDVIAAGATRIAVVRAIMNSKNPEIASRNLKTALTKREKLHVEV